MPCDDCLSRREFLSRSGLAVVGAAALAVGCGDGQFGPAGVTLSGRQVAFKASTISGLATTGQWVLIPSDSDFRAVKRTGPASFVAISTVCTHQGCATDIRGNAFECPCHGARYDTNGKVTQQPNAAGSATNLPAVTVTYDAASDALTVG
jgi:Rieske Fe-S protein